MGLFPVTIICCVIVYLIDTIFYATGIDIVNAEPKSIPTDGKVYSIDGRYIGTLGVGGFTMDALNKGIYIVGGKRVMVK
ncbi:MAG: hypothetical protein IJ610_02235 [Bacteroidaceae bacterium]|nr:hypothetical protein [Bacteroidaceae bacterium]